MITNLHVWWIPQIPGEAFRVPVKDLEQGAFLLNALALYDQFQLDHNIKPDYCNMGGMEYTLANGEKESVEEVDDMEFPEEYEETYFHAPTMTWYATYKDWSAES